MAGGLICVGDLAQAMIAAANAPTRGATRLVELRLDIRAFVKTVPEGDAVWALRLRPPGVRRPTWLAWLRRPLRRRAGWTAQRLTLRWTPRHLEAAIDDRSIARLSFPDH